MPKKMTAARRKALRLEAQRREALASARSAEEIQGRAAAFLVGPQDAPSADAPLSPAAQRVLYPLEVRDLSPRQNLTLHLLTTAMGQARDPHEALDAAAEDFPQAVALADRMLALPATVGGDE